MKKLILIILLLTNFAAAQNASNKYEAELLGNPNQGGKDTREINAVLIFEENRLVIKSRRKNEVFKEIKYADLKYVEHSFSKNPQMTESTRAVLLAALFGSPLFYMREEKHWLTILSGNDFAVLKIENDNYRLLKMEFLVREIEIVNVNEDRQ